MMVQFHPGAPFYIVLMDHKKERAGEWAAIGHLVLDGFWPVGAAYGTQFLGLAPIGLLGWASFFASLFFIALVWQKKCFSQLFDRRFLGGSALYTVCMLLPYAAIFYAAKSNTAMDVSLLTQSEVIFAALIGWLFLKEKIQSYRVIGVLFVFIANIIVLYDGGVDLQSSSLILIFAPVVFVFGNTIAKRLQANGMDFRALLLFRSFLGGGALILTSLFLESSASFSREIWLFLFAFGFLAFGLPKALWQIALNKIDLSKTTAIGLSYPAFSFLFAYLLMGEIPTLYHWLGLGLSFTGIWFLMKSSSRALTELASPVD